jgi:pimeloyl-ACP methyl ester carboxylesterase
MSSQQTLITTHSVETPSGRISYASAGFGPVALFVHGVVLNKHLWRHQLAGLSDIRRCIAVDLLAHGDTEITPDQDVSVTANAKMLKEVLDAMMIDGSTWSAMTAAEALLRSSRRSIPSGCGR